MDNQDKNTLLTDIIYFLNHHSIVELMEVVTEAIKIQKDRLVN